MRPRVFLLTALVAGGPLASLIAALLIVGTLVLILSLAATDSADAAEGWSPPVPGRATRLFRYGPHPFLAGQHRGVDFAARGAVRAACAGRVVFAGRVAGAGTVSQRCGRWRVSYAPLTRIVVRAGAAAGPGSRLGRATGELHFGVRREGRRFGYVDPLRFLRAPRTAPPVAAPPPVRRPEGRPRVPAARSSPRLIAARPHAPPAPVVVRPDVTARPPPAVAPWPVWLGLVFGLTGLLGAGRLRLPYRRQEGAPCRASSTSSSSPTIPSSR
jgi:hypothetical protein